MLRYIYIFCPQHILITISISMLSSILSVLNVLFLKYTIDSITGGSSFIKVSIFLGGLLIMQLGFMLLNSWLQHKVMPKNVQTISQKMQMMLFKKAVEVEVKCYEDTDFYNKFTLAMQQADSRALAVLNTFSMFIGSLFGIGAFSTLIGLYEPVILGVVLLRVALSFYINTCTIKVQHQYNEERVPFQREIGYQLRIFYLQNYAKELRLFEGLPELMRKMYSVSTEKVKGLIETYGKKLMNMARNQGGIGAISSTGVMIYLSYKVLKSILTIGDFIALSNSSQQLGGQITNFMSIFPQLYEHSLYIENFKEFVDYKPTIQPNEDGVVLNKVPSIELQNVSFSYSNSNKNVLDRVNIKIKSGEKVAFVGRNGAGKSTLVKLITRLYDPVEGNILIDGIPYYKYNTKSIRESIGIIFQDYQGYAMSIIENILMREIVDKEADEKLVERALIFSGLYDKVSSLPDGMYTKLTKEFSNKGTLLSGGELQKLAIARVYARKCNIIILDEPSSSLDPIAENEMFNSMLSSRRQNSNSYITPTCKRKKCR